MIPKINSSHGSETRNLINRAIEVLNRLGIDVQTLVAEGQLTEEQYSDLIATINGHLKSGEVDKYDLSQGLRTEINQLRNKIDIGNVSLNDLHPDVLSAINNGEGTPLEILSIPRDRSVTPEKTSFFELSKNLFNKENIVLNKSFDNDTGELVDDVRWASLDFIPITPGETISLNADSALRVATYREDFSFISRSGTTAPPTKYTSTSSNARYIRFSGIHDPELLMVNRGEVMLPYEPHGDVIKSEHLPEMQTEDIDASAIKEEIINELSYINAKNPYPPRLSNLIEIQQGPETPLWLSSDGDVLYGRGRRGTMPVMSTDEWGTHTQIGSSDLPAYIYGMRELPDGELLASTSRNEAEGVKAKVFKTAGFDKSNPSSATWVEVLEAGSTLANIQNSWGFDSYDNIVLVSEYGRQGLDGSRYAYISTDYGDNFTQIFDLVEQEVLDRPAWDSDAHIHTIAYDPYFNRIWLCVGDGLNSATYYSDNYGNEWSIVDNPNDMQYTGIIAMEDCVVFGSDRAPNGVYIYRRKDKATKPKIVPWYILNDELGISQIFQLPFRRNRNKETPVYFNATSSKTADNPNESLVMAFIDGKKAHLIYETEPIHSLANGAGVTAALGDTSQGNVILVVSMPDQSGSTTYKVKAPLWE